MGGFAEQLEELRSSYSGTSEDISKFNALREQLIAANPGIESAIGGEVAVVGELAGAYESVTEAIKEMSLTQAIAAQEEALRNRGTYAMALKEGLFGYTEGASPLSIRELGMGPDWYKTQDRLESGFEKIKSADRSGWGVGTYQVIRDLLQNQLYDVTANDPYNNEYKKLLDQSIRRIDLWIEQAKEAYGTKIRDGISGIVEGALNPDQLEFSELQYLGEMTDTITE